MGTANSTTSIVTKPLGDENALAEGTTDDLTEGATNLYESTQASGSEITAGTETSTRSHSPADIVAYISQHGGGG